MDIKELKKFITEENDRLQQNYLLDYDVDKRILHAVAKLSEESGELTEVVLKKMGTQRSVKLNEYKDEQLESEIADVIIVTSIIAELTGVDIEKALTEKIKRIENRYNNDGKEK
jgi:NTP pyrophosphatase (non-canonical NTP hydrolase)